MFEKDVFVVGKNRRRQLRYGLAQGGHVCMLLVTVLFVYVRSGWGWGGEVCQDMGMERYGDVESTVEMIRL